MVPNIDGKMGHKIKTRRHPRWNTVRYSVSNKQKLSTNPSRKCNNCIWASLVQLIAKISEKHRNVKTEKFKFELDKFLELIPAGPKMPNYVTASRSNSILGQLTHLGAQGIYRCGGVPDSVMEQS